MNLSSGSCGSMFLLAPAYNRQMDADTLITNPAVRIHDTLPPRHLSPSPMILGEYMPDDHGFCNGIIFYRVSHRMATFFARLLTIEYNIVEPESSILKQVKTDLSPPLDQRATALTLMAYKDAQDRFYKYPRSPFGSFFPMIDQFKQGRPEESFETADDIRAQLHLAGDRKDIWEWERLLHLEEEVYANAASLAWELGVDSNGLELMPDVEKVRRVMSKWWANDQRGIEGIDFPSW